MSQPLVSSSGLSSSSSGQGKRIYINEIPLPTRQQLCNHLDELKTWEQLAVVMGLRQEQIQRIHLLMQRLGNSPSDELLRIWSQYNHTTTELFFALRKLKLHQAMRMLKDFVEVKFHVCIPNSRPELSVLLAQDKSNIDEESKKKLNINTSSGVSDSNMNYSTDSKSMTSDLNQPASILTKHADNEYEINYNELAEATNNWSDNFILGRGGFGTVFKGSWKLTDVAIKQIDYRGNDGRESVRVQIQQSMNELKYLNAFRHDNILPLYGFSINGEKPCLVYQLMSRGSLEKHLNSKDVPPLTLQQRRNICLGVARGINYLHTLRSDKPLIHGDIKPANVLLDQCFIPKIGDFGLAREGPNPMNSAVEVSQIFGTKFYLPPEFLKFRKLSIKVDIYSFGVVLLEVFTGLRAYVIIRRDAHQTKHIMNLCERANNRLELLIDQRISSALLPGEGDMCKRILNLGLQCISDSPQQRPHMSNVYDEINNAYNSRSNQQ